MAMTKTQGKQLEELLKTKLKEQYNRGVRVGILSVSKVVLDKLSDRSKPLTKRIEEIKKYCAVATQQGFLTKGIDDTLSVKDISDN